MSTYLIKKSVALLAIILADMTNPIPLKAVFLLTLAPMLWATNAVVGRLISEMIPPMTLNFARWFLAILILTPFATNLFKERKTIRAAWLRLALLGLTSMGCYNSFQYLALHTSSALNVTLVGAGMPVWMLLIGRLFFKHNITPKAWIGAALSLLGVAVVILRGEVTQISSIKIVPGDGWMILATWGWASYSWLLAKPTPDQEKLRGNWVNYLMIQMLFGIMWAGAFTSIEWTLPILTNSPLPEILWSDGKLAWALVFVAIGPALISYRCWGAGIAIAGASAAGFFANLTPLFTGILSTFILGEAPHLYHGLAFFLIVAGIVISSKK